MVDEIKAAAYRQLAENSELNEVFAELERDTFEDLLRLPMWTSARKRNALIERVKVIRDLQQRIKHLGVTRVVKKQSVV